MTDVTVAPQGSAPPAAPANEVPITNLPASSPQPIGSQAPEKPVGPDFKGSEHRPQSRREAIQAAFDRAANPQAARQKNESRPAPRPAEAKPGHNKPPGPIESEKLDLKKRPAPDQVQRADQARDQARAEQPRDRGRFVAREQSNGPAPQSNQAQQPPQPKQLPGTASYRDPVSRMSEAAKRDWATTPESVRGDVHRMHQEFKRASDYYKADHEAMQSIRPYHQLAQQQGTTLQQALSNYVGMERKLREDPIGGLDVIIHNLNLKTPDGQRLGLRDIAYHVLSQTPEQLRSIQQGNQQQAAAQQIGSLHQQVADLKNMMNQMHNQQQFTYTRAAVDQFADAHPRFDELGDLIESELKLGFDLDTAYRRAELLRPATAAQTRTTSAQTRPTADRSISGAPDAARLNGASRRSDKPVGRREAIQNAIDRVQGSF